MILLLLIFAGMFIPHNYGFWVFLIIFFIGDSFLYYKGHDTFLWKHKTEAEKQIQLSQIRRDELNDKNSY